MTDESGAAWPASKAALLERIGSERAGLEHEVAGIPEARLLAAGAEGWSAKDHLAHIAAWERVLIALLRGAPEREAFALDEATLATMNTDGVNAILRGRSAALPLSDVLAEFQAAHAAVLALLEDLPEPALFAALAADDPRPRMQKIAGDTYLHYEEHRAWIVQLFQV